MIGSFISGVFFIINLRVLQMRAIVIDDEALARKRILNLLTTVNEVEVLDECANGKRAIKQINSLEPELVFRYKYERYEWF